MYSIRPPAIIALFLIVAVLIPQSLFSQTAPRPSKPSQPATPKRQTMRPQRADALAAVISDLLRLDPLAPRSLDEKDSENANASSKEKGKPPADDAPIKELIDYYWDQNHGANIPKPSDKVRQRLLEACEDRPGLTLRLIECLPETPDADDRLYKLLEEDDGENSAGWKASLQNWLLRNSRYFRDDLLAAAREEAANGTPPGENLRSLARLDWEAARPLVRHNLQTGEEFQVNLPGSALRPPFMYLAAHGKVLLGYSGYHNSHYLGPVNHLLDAETGAIQEAKGDFEPLNDDFTRELQPRGNRTRSGR
jgi:hypothetical protein